MLDRGLSFGIQNFLFLKSDETDGTYNYYLYQTHNGSILIQRTNKALSEIKYFLGSGVVDTIWTAKARKTYEYPSDLEFPNI